MPGSLMMHTSIPERCKPVERRCPVKNLEERLSEQWKPLMSQTATSTGKNFERSGTIVEGDDDVRSGFMLSRTSYSSAVQVRSSLDNRIVSLRNENSDYNCGRKTRSKRKWTTPFFVGCNEKNVDTIPESKRTMVMWPVGDPGYFQGPQLRRFVGYSLNMVRTVGIVHVSNMAVLKGYHDLFASCADVYKAKGRVGEGLFTRTKVRPQGWI